MVVLPGFETHAVLKKTAEWTDKWSDSSPRSYTLWGVVSTEGNWRKLIFTVDGDIAGRIKLEVFDHGVSPSMRQGGISILLRRSTALSRLLRMEIPNGILQTGGISDSRSIQDIMDNPPEQVFARVVKQKIEDAEHLLREGAEEWISKKRAVGREMKLELDALRRIYKIFGLTSLQLPGEYA